MCSRSQLHTSSVLQEGGAHTGSTWTADGSQAGRRSRKGLGEGHTHTLQTAGEGCQRVAPHVAPPPMRMGHLLSVPRVASLRHPFGHSPLHSRSLLPPLPAEQTVRSLRHASLP
jgi:hypothetical protein